MTYGNVADIRALFGAANEITKIGGRLFFIGKSILGVPLPCLRIGRGKECSLLVGAHHGMEHITADLLIKFAYELVKGQICAKETTEARTVFIIPMLNPDGCMIATGGVGETHPLYAQLAGMNGGADFSHWQANARGVDLNHNYDAGFDKCKERERELGITSCGPTRYGGERPESEPESAALCALTRIIAPRLKVAVALHTQGEEIYFDYNEKVPRGAAELAERFSAASGYALSEPEAAASHGGYKDWVIDKFDIPAFTIECGKGENPLPPSDFDDIYVKVRGILCAAAEF